MVLILIWLICTPLAIVTLAAKNRGIGYYLLAIFCPIPGLIVSLCLKSHLLEKAAAESPNLDITKEDEITPDK